MRTEEQINAVCVLSDREVHGLRQFDSLAADAVGLDGVCPHSCVTNGWHTCEELGITRQNGFIDREIQIAVERFTVRTALLFELI